MLAKAGLKPDGKTKADYNQWIVEKFQNRVYGEKYPVRSFVSVRDMFEEETDLYSVTSLITISMDFDWKRKVDHDTVALRKVGSTDHLFFETLPWQKAVDSEECKKHWVEFSTSNQCCLKTIEDMNNFRIFSECQKIMLKREGRNNPRKGNVPMKIFRSWFARAYVNGAYGLPSPKTRRPSYWELEHFFAKHGLEGMRAALSNCRSKDVDPPNIIPLSPDVLALVRIVVNLFPSFDTTKVFSTSSIPMNGE